MSMSSEPVLPASTFYLYCELIEQDDVTAVPTRPGMKLSEVQTYLLAEFPDKLKGLDPSKLLFVKFDSPVSIEPFETFARRAKSMVVISHWIDNLVPKTERVEPFHSESEIMLALLGDPIGNDGPPNPNNVFNLYHRYPSWLSRAYNREDTVHALKDQVLREKFVLVRGTPGCGKTTLLWLLRRHIETTVPGALTEMFHGWLDEQTLTTPLDRRLQFKGKSQRLSLSMVHNLTEQRRVFIFMDDAQDTFWDTALWTSLVKDILDRRLQIHLVMFAAYGSSFRTGLSSHGTFQRIPSTAIMGLFSTDDVPHKLLFNDHEVECLFAMVEERVNNQDELEIPIVDEDLKKYIKEITNGHIGAMLTLLGMAGTAKKKLNRNGVLSVSLESFLTRWRSPLSLFDGLKAKDPFSRGLPTDHDLAGLNCVEISLFRETIVNGCQGIHTHISLSHTDRLQAAEKLKRFGWLYSCESSGTRDDLVLQTATSLHCAWLSHRLHKPTLPLHVARMTLDTLWQTAVSKFSRSALAESVCAGNKYAYEFYRCLYDLTGGACFVSPEFMQTQTTPSGRIDFFISATGWGIELLRDGDHFDTQDKYHPWLQNGTITQYVILDFRQKPVQDPHPRWPQLFHVVFDDTFTTYQIVDHQAKSGQPLVLLC